jgi:hypothetical protein
VNKRMKSEGRGWGKREEKNRKGEEKVRQNGEGKESVLKRNGRKKNKSLTLANGSDTSDGSGFFYSSFA